MCLRRIAALLAVGLAVSGASNVSQFTYQYMSAVWAARDPDSTVIITAGETMHIALVKGVVEIPAAGAIGLFIVNDGTPCRNNATNAPNGRPVFASGATFATDAPAGQVQTMAIDTANSGMTVGQSLCIIDMTQVYPDSRATLTIGLGP